MTAVSHQTGSATIAVITASMLLAASALGAFGIALSSRAAAQRRIAHLAAQRAALDLCGLIGQWFDAAERGAVVPPPPLGDLTRGERRLDPELDGTYSPYGSVAAPWNVMLHHSGGDPWRPSSAALPERTFAGAADGPDLCVDPERGRTTLVALASVVSPHRPLQIVRLCLYRPELGVPDGLATIDVVVESTVTPQLVVRARARGMARVLVPESASALASPRLDRPLSITSDAVLTGAVVWHRGEAFVGGDLAAEPGTLDLWPGGIPWLRPDHPLHDDEDADGVEDDADGDGDADLASWRALPGSVPDPWWRARIGGRFDRAPAAAAVCTAPWPFGPRATPPAAASRSWDRSGLFIACPSAVSTPPIPPTWRALAQRLVRGALAYQEDPSRPNCFQLDGVGACVAPERLLPARGGLALVVAALTRSEPLELTLAGSRGALLVSGCDLVLRGRRTTAAPQPIPATPRDTGGEERSAARNDRLAPLTSLDAEGGAWDVAPWIDRGSSGGAQEGSLASSAERHHRGLIACDRHLELIGPLQLEGTIQAATLEAHGEIDPIDLWGTGGVSGDAGRRSGPEGVPWVVVVDRRPLP